MKRIISNNITIWRGNEYLVDGKPGKVDPPAIILTEVDDGPPPHDPTTHYVTRSEGVVGDKWLALYETHERPLAVPEMIEGWQALLTIKAVGLEAKIRHAIDQLPEPAKSTAASQFNTGAPWLRRGPLVLQLIESIPELTPAYADQLFIQGSQIPKS